MSRGQVSQVNGPRHRVSERPPQEVTLAESWRGGRTYLERRRSITRYMFPNQERRLRVRK